ncbi:uncharacterized protein EAF01_007840 [Botrytis porri]|uniref:Transmembrane protein n=1 Tax=Botrytis porri TaxID=87229 RepID=A0A4Z1KQL0_9HELO|nr:uncharacterized protein EAF01_007840 [Botrytis porri]KAF7900538.1 hypothetical protein EAF01_007840 [Botrytis porri]TGO86224.1 hypothetical protein BPOR_0322g00040 [Botrytis porri]
MARSTPPYRMFFAAWVVAGLSICLWQMSPQSPSLESRTMIFDPNTEMQQIATYADNSTLPSLISSSISTSTSTDV